MKKYLLNLVLVLFTSCFQNDYLSNPDSVLSISNSEMKTFESGAIEASTYFKDSIGTNLFGSFVLGDASDPIRGRIKAIPYLEFGLQEQIEFDNSARLDSIVLVLFYDHFQYDTLPEFGINIYELDEKLETDNESGLIYSSQTFQKNEVPIQSVKIRFLPHRDSLVISLPKIFGEKLFEMGKSGESIFGNNEDLVASFKGLVIKPTSESPLVSFSKNSYLGFYYKNSLEQDRVNQLFKIYVANGEHMYTQLQFDKSETLFAPFKSYQNIPASSIQNLALADRLTGAGIRITFPNIGQELENSSEYYIFSAFLELPVKTNTYDNYLNLPSTRLSLYLVNKNNIIQEYIGDYQLSSYDEQFRIHTYFRIPVKYYLDKIRNNRSLDQMALWITVPPESILKGNYIVVGENSSLRKLKLNISVLPLN